MIIKYTPTRALNQEVRIDDKLYLCRNLRMGLCFPENQFPGFMTVMGQGTAKFSNKQNESVNIVMIESTADTLVELLTTTFTTAKLLEIEYLNMRLEPERDKEFYQELMKFKRENKITRVGFRTHNYANNFSIGLDLIYSYIKKNKLRLDENSVAYNNLQVMTAEDKQRWHGQFAAVQSLICALGGYNVFGLIAAGSAMREDRGGNKEWAAFT